MKNKRILDKEKREVFKKTELEQKIYKMLLLTLESHKNIYNDSWDFFNSKVYYQFKYYLLLKRHGFNSKGFLTKVSNRCIWTGRSKSTYKKFRLSRLTLKKLCSNKQIPGYYKCSW